MAAHQFWRLTGFVTDSDVLELSQAQLYDGVQLIAQAPTFTVSPTTGTAFPDTLHWDDFSMPGFALTWNLETPVASPNLRLGAGSSADNFPKEFYCQYSDDGQFWSTNNAPVNIDFPGAGLMTAAPAGGTVAPAVLQAYRYYRFSFLTTDHAGYMAFAEIYGVNGTTNVSLLGKTYTVNKTPDWGTASTPYDGNSTNYTGVSPGRLPFVSTVDLSTATMLTGVGLRVTNADFSSTAGGPKSFDVLGSQDGTAWDTLAEVRNGASWSLGERRDFTLTAPAVQSVAAGDPLASQFADSASADIVLSSDKKTATVSGSNGAARGCSFASSGVRQFEVDVSGSGLYFVGVAEASVVLTGGSYYQGASVRGIGSDGITRDGTVGWGSSVALPSPCTLGVVVNFTTGEFKVYRDGVFKATVFSNVAGVLAPMVGGMNSATVVHTLRSNSFVYPVSGATDWAGAYVPPAATSVFIPLTQTPAAKRWRLVGKGQERIAGSELPAHNLREVPAQTSFMDAYHGGRGIIRASVKQKNTPVNTPLRRRVDLMDERSRLVIRSTWSDLVTGIYAFAGIREDLVYTVVSYDPLHSNRAVIADNLTLANGGVELMP